MGLIDAVTSIVGTRLNKWGKKEYADDTKEGVASDLTPELTLNIKDEDLLRLANEWDKKWENSTLKGEWLTKAEENEKYWLGKQYSKAETDVNRPLIDNAIFESLETFLPLATRRNPEPNVTLTKPQDEENEIFTNVADAVEQQLASLADKGKLRLKIKKAARHWSLYLIGVAKLGWSSNEDDITVKVIRPQKLILDPEGTIDEDGYTGKYIGEYREMEAAILIKLVDNHADYIKELVKGDLGTAVRFKEYWTNEYTCWILNDKVLRKKQNPHWNYDTPEKVEETVDEFGAIVPNVIPLKPGQNHFSTPKMPYVFLSIFNLGKQPIDETSLISQVLSQQDLINKRLKQIDRNADSMNNGMVVSMERSGLTREQATGVTEALRKGGTVVIPSGAPSDAVARMSAPALPSDVYSQMADTRVRLRDNFGVSGSTPAGIKNEDTVRGKIITKGLDTDRIGGGITEYLEQFADDIYNYAVQMMFVYYPEFQGQQIPKLLVSVSEGSLLPKDNTTLANQAIELAIAGKMSLLDMFEKLEYPNPEKLAANVWLEVNAPQILYANDPRVQQVMMQQQQAAQQQAEMQVQQGQQQMQMEQEGKQVDQKNKLELQDRKQQGDLLKQVTMNNAKSTGK